VAGWEDIREFTVGNVSRPATRTHNRMVADWLDRRVSFAYALLAE
jgi:hypothetical protein